MSPELSIQQPRERYRHLVAEGLNIARSYDGSEAAFQHLMGALERLEVGLTTLGFSGTTQAQETEAALRFTEKNPHEINELLSAAAESQRRSMALEQERHPYVYLQYPGVFLQPGQGKRPIVPGDGRRTYEARFDNIVNDFITFLRAQKIFADDVIVTLGQEPPDKMMRQETYVKVEIPRIGKTVLLCNQIGEATFVLQGYVPDDILTCYTKDDLQNNTLFAARKVVRGPGWQTQITEYLFNEVAWGKKDKREETARTKVPLEKLHATREKVAAAIRTQYNTPEQWIELGVKDIRNETVLDRGFVAIGSIFGIGDPIRSRSVRLQLGLIVWPNSEVIKKAIEIEQRTPEQWHTSIIAAGWTDEKWLATQPREIEIEKHKLSFFAVTFNVVTNNPLDQLGKLRTGQAIWPDSVLIKAALEIEERTPEEWRTAIEAAGWTPEKWEKITDSFVFEAINGRGLTAFETIFGLRHSNRNRQDRLRLGLAIWPDSPVLKKAIEIDARTPDQWRAAIAAAEWIPERFMVTQPRDFKVDGYRIMSIRSIFGVDGNPIQHLLPRLALGLAIWPGDLTIQTAYDKEHERLAHIESVADLTPDQWREEVVAAGWTPEKWAATAQDHVAQIIIKGLSLALLARKFHITGFPANIRKVFFQLGLAIWPNDPTLQSALEKALKNKS